MTDNHAEYDAIDDGTVHRIGKLLLATVALILLLGLVSVLPGIDRLVPGSPVTFMALVSAIVTILLVGLLLSLAPAVRRLVRSALDGPRLVVDDIAMIAQLLVVFVGIVIAHRGLAPATVPLLDGLAWFYDLAFFLIALPPLAVIAYQVYASLDPMAELLTDRVTTPTTDDESTEESE
jgi:hypothetical protein